MFTDKHFPPTFLSKNPSLRDMVKDQTDYDRRITDISTNFKRETSRENERSTFQRSRTRTDYEKQHYSSNPSTQAYHSNNDPVKRPSSRGLPIYPVDLRIGEERAVRASQRRTMRNTPTRQLDVNLTLRPNTPNILLSSSYGDNNMIEDRGTKSQIIFPRLSYGRITPSRDLFPTVDDTNQYTNVTLHRPSEYYRNTTSGYNTSQTNQFDAFTKFRPSQSTSSSITRHFDKPDLAKYNNSPSAKYSSGFQTSQRQSPRPFSVYQRSNSTSGSTFRSATPSQEANRGIYSTNIDHSSSQDLRSNGKTKSDSDSYFTDKYYSKDFLSSSKPLSEMLKNK